ncbi:MAG: MSCRAMM family protein, partial [Dehalococcoidia bacterium]
MHRILLLLLAIAACARSGTIQGVVLEQATGRPLSRTVLRLEPVQKSGATPLQPLAMRSGRSGQFVFPPVAPGTYLLHAMRGGYFPAAYGQRLPIGHGTPFEVTADSTLFAEVRLRRKGAITGRALDENGVATAGIPVVAYRARLPLRSSGTAISDDRGVFRIPSLDPGKYWVRSGAFTLDDGSGWLPTFGPQSREPHDARVHAVTVDGDTTDADISPDPGSLFRLGGIVTCDAFGPAIVTLSSETGRRRTQTACGYPYRFDGLSPGNYEVFATLPDLPPAGFLELFVDRAMDSANVAVMQLPTVEIEVRNAG